MALPADPDAGPGGVEVVTFGCRLNAFESEVIRRAATDAGAAGTVVVNTCAVTAEAERQARQTIRRLRRERPDARIVVTGCAAQLRPEAFAAMPEVDQVLGNREKLAAANFASAERVRVNDIMAVRDGASHLVAGFEGRVRAFVEIQNGCDHRCTFCVIPFARGNNRSVAPAEVIGQVARLVDEGGYREVVLTGVDITAYGSDRADGASLAGLVRGILRAVPGLARLRLSSLDPAEVDDALIDALAEEPRLMPHVHLSLQAGDDLVLKRMKRRHAAADAVRLAARLRAVRPDLALGADLIAGFPTEDEAMFANTLGHVRDLGLVHLHVFPFSPRAGTPAARMPQVPVRERRERAERLRDLGRAQLAACLAAQVGQRTEVLLESETAGRTAAYAPVRLMRRVDGEAAGALVPATVVGAEAASLLAVPA